MEAAAYLDTILLRYSGTFDISRPYELDGQSFDAYGYFCSRSEKYVLTRKANLWTVDAFEHILFRSADKLTPADIGEAARLISGPMQDAFVTKGRKYPEQDHMYSYLTAVLISREAVDIATATAAKLYRFEKGYLFNFRGFARGRLVVVDLANEAVTTSKSAKALAKMYENAFADPAAPVLPGSC